MKHRIARFPVEHKLPFRSSEKELLVLAFLALMIFARAPDQRAFAQSPSAEPADQQAQQQLTLFEPVAGAEQTAAANRAQQRDSGQVGPAFTLVGTSRIGSKYTALLASRDGSITRVSAVPGSSAEIPDHAGYRVVDIGSRQVSLTTPRNDPCIEAQDKGVSCSAIGVTQLSLTTAAPMANPVQNPGEAPATAGGDGADPNAPPENPFAAAIRMAREAEASGQLNARERRAANREAFQQLRRIAPEDVPPGMRVVRTPFGDRLVPNQ